MTRRKKVNPWVRGGELRFGPTTTLQSNSAYARIAHEEAKRADVIVERWLKTTHHGTAMEKRRVRAPTPVSRQRFEGFMHEVAHVELGHPGKVSRTTPVGIVELEATERTIQRIRARGLEPSSNMFSLRDQLKSDLDESRLPHTVREYRRRR